MRRRYACLTRPSVSHFIATRIDGFIARDGGSLDWLDIVQVPGEDQGFGAFFASVDTLALGRKTWETTLGSPEWPRAGRRLVVFGSSQTLPQPPHAFVSEL